MKDMKKIDAEVLIEEMDLELKSINPMASVNEKQEIVYNCMREDLAYFIKKLREAPEVE